MFRSTILVAAASLVALSALTVDASAKPRMLVFDNKGKVLFDDGKLDGKGCVVGKEAVFNPKTGKIGKKTKVKCNF